MEIEGTGDGSFTLSEGELKITFNSAVLHRWKGRKLTMQEIRLDDDKGRSIKVKELQHLRAVL